jgi:outer membrane murein-binding lipoprotein Lpp
MEIFTAIATVGFPVAASIAGGFFIFTTLKFILAGVSSSVASMGGIVNGLNNRIDAMANDLQRIDIQVSYALGLEPDMDRVARAKAEQARRD